MSLQDFSVLERDDQSTDSSVTRRAHARDAEAWLASWLAEYIAKLMDMPTEEVDPEQTFARFGLDSASSLGMTGDLAELLECRIAESLVFEQPTIHQLSRCLAGKAEVQQAYMRRIAGGPAALVALPAR